MGLESMLTVLRGDGWSVAVHNDYRQDGHRNVQRQRQGRYQPHY